MSWRSHGLKDPPDSAKASLGVLTKGPTTQMRRLRLTEVQKPSQLRSQKSKSIFSERSLTSTCLTDVACVRCSGSCVLVAPVSALGVGVSQSWRNICNPQSWNQKKAFCITFVKPGNENSPGLWHSSSIALEVLLYFSWPQFCLISETKLGNRIVSK